MTHPFLSLTDADRDAMLETIGVSSVEELFRDVPERMRFRGTLDLERPLPASTTTTSRRSSTPCSRAASS